MTSHVVRTLALFFVCLISVVGWAVGLVSVGATAAVVGTACLLGYMLGRDPIPNMPPMLPFSVPFVGHAFEYGMDPLALMKRGYKDAGEIFRIKIMGNDWTFFCGPNAQEAFFRSKEEVLNARAAYSFTVPVFGKNVVYDTNEHVFAQQRQFMSKGLTMQHFKKYIEVIRKETEMYLDENWKDSGETCLMEGLNEITVLTSVRALQGPEVRAQFNKDFAKLYLDLDKALGAISFFFPNLPIPVHSRRDSARKAIGELYQKIIDKRRADNEDHSDLMHQLIHDCTYDDGENVPDDQIISLCIGLLLAGQHTSNVTSTWLGVNFLSDPAVYDKIKAEQRELFPDGFDLDYEKYKKMNYLQACLKESLRLRPPIIFVFRKALEDFQYGNMTIPTGSMCCVSPAISNRLEEIWTNPDQFDPSRFDEGRQEDTAKSNYVYLPFSAGKHACIGEKFAYLQICIIWSVLLERYDFELLKKNPAPDYTTLIVSPVTPVTVRYTKRQ